VNTWTKTQ